MSNNTAESWDAAAGRYQQVYLQGQSEYNGAVHRLWETEGLFRPGDRVLDLGCGVGRHGVYFAGHGCDVTLADFSPAMLSYAEGNMAFYKGPWRTYCCDFSEVTGNEDVFSGGFDFTISTFSGAVADAAAIRKMSRMTHGWCFLSRFREWREDSRRELLLRAGMEPGEPVRDMSAECERLIQAVSAAGYTPHTRYVDYNWSDLRTPEEMADLLASRHGADENQKQALAQAAYSLRPGSPIPDAVQTRALWLWWHAGN